MPEPEQYNEQFEQDNQPEATMNLPEAGIPTGIVRLREEWAKLGLNPAKQEKQQVGLEPIVFPEPVGDYRVVADDVRALLGLSEDAMNRLLSGGELDSILVKFETGPRRMVSEASLSRFLEDSGMAPELSGRLTLPADEVAAMLESLKEEIQETKDLHARQLQQFKDVLLLELRNLKEQDRDLTSFVFDLTEALEELNPKLKKRRRTPPLSGDER
jgi:hypothetical protein